jgi:ABC-type uncharacterized transport system involved in gliding motility auxiliary subunit
MNASPAAMRGYALGLVCRVVLLVTVLGQVVYLGNRYRHRTDLTADQLYTLTSSTQKVLDGLDDRLLIECYFTRDDRLPAWAQDQRRELRSVLDEYARRTQGKVQVQFFDPQSDDLLRQRAERLQMQPQVVENLEIGELKQQVIWQGVRLRYGERQEVIRQLPLAASTFQYEAWLTPSIKDLTVKVKPKVKIWAAPPRRNDKIAKTYHHIRSWQRFDFSDLDLSEGKLVPDDVGIVLLIRPRDLKDRDKYALDQFLMRGGKLVVFADTGDVDVGNNDYRSFATTPIDYDTGDSRWLFLDQLAHYGVKVEDKVVSDWFTGRGPRKETITAQEPIGRILQGTTGVQPAPIFYPYVLHALPIDWGTEEFAKLAASNLKGEVDPTRVAQYRGVFKVGLKTDHPLAMQQQFGPGMFWPCPVDLADKLPDGVTGEVVARTSPWALVEKLGRDVNPFGLQSADHKLVDEALKSFETRMLANFQAAPRRQVGLVVALQGTFPSFYAGKALPPRKPVVKAEPDPLTEKVGKEGDDKPKPDAEKPDGNKPDDGVIGPPVAGNEPPAEDKDRDPPFLERASAGAQLVVIGDADFLRDDYLTGAYNQGGRAMVYGPASDVRAGTFYQALLDWLVQDFDLMALRSKVGSDRTIRLGQQEVMRGESMESFLQRVNKKATYVQWLNVLAPAGLLLVVWALVAFRRRQRKAAFLAQVGN